MIKLINNFLFQFCFYFSSILFTTLFFSCKSSSKIGKTHNNKNVNPSNNKAIVDTFNYLNQFKSLSLKECEDLWFREIETPFETHYTRFWSGSSFPRYTASHSRFIEHYKNKQHIPIAFQFGPKDVLREYQTYVVKKIKAKYLLVKTVYRHGRFIAKHFVVFNKRELRALYNIINKQDSKQIENNESEGYCGYFVDNKNEKQFYINFDESYNDKGNQNNTDTVSQQYSNPANLELLYNYFDKTIQWQIGFKISQKSK